MDGRIVTYSHMLPCSGAWKIMTAHFPSVQTISNVQFEFHKFHTDNYDYDRVLLECQPRIHLGIPIAQIR